MPVDSNAVAVLVAGVKAVAGRPRAQSKPPAAAAPAGAGEAAVAGDAAPSAVPPPTAAVAAPADEALIGLLRAAAGMLRALHEAGNRISGGGGTGLGGGRARLMVGVDAEHVSMVAAEAQEAGMSEERTALEQLAALL